MKVVLITSPSGFGNVEPASGGSWVGDALVAAGVQHLLQQAGLAPEIQQVYRDEPWSWRDEHAKSRFAQADLVIQAGMPLLGHEVTTRPWFKAFEDEVLKAPVPLWLVSIGSYFPSRFTPRRPTMPDRRYMQRLVQRAKLVITHDEWSRQVLAQFGEVHLLPSAAGFIGEAVKVRPEPPEYLALGYRPSGSTIRPKPNEAWQQLARKLFAQLAERFPVKLVCHHPGEQAYATELKLPSVLPQTLVECARVYGAAYGALTNHVYGAVLAAAMDRPALATGTDSEIEALGPFGLPYVYTEDAQLQPLLEFAERAYVKYREWAPKLAQLRAKAAEQYVALFKRSV